MVIVFLKFYDEVILVVRLKLRCGGFFLVFDFLKKMFLIRSAEGWAAQESN